MELTEEILCWVKADNTRTMLTIGWIIGKKLPNYFQKIKCSILIKNYVWTSTGEGFPPLCCLSLLSFLHEGKSQFSFF